MSRYNAEDYIDKAAQMPSIEWVSLTGGEPMLHPSLVEGLVAYASERGLQTELVTNCTWAESPERAVGTLRRLADAGLHVLNMSADDFHQIAIPFERVRNCYEAAKRLGIKMVAMTALKRSSRIDLSEVSRLLGEEVVRPGGSDAPQGSVMGLESGFIPVGRGANIPRAEWRLEGSPLTGGCEEVLRDIGVRPSGDVLPCCSASAALFGFSIGNLSEWDLGDLIEEAWRSDVFKILREKGPMGFEDAQPEGVYVNKCHLCNEVLKPILATPS
jgi:MoaA/NifB/PqqE/SkfB family radical SAM enzyme